MKAIHLILISLFIGLSLNSQAQTSSKKIGVSTFEVNGVCGMCKDRIENAALVKGVKLVEWDKEGQALKVIYKKKKVDLATIQQAIADAGHDTETVKASDDAYNNLHHCCRYREMDVH